MPEAFCLLTTSGYERDVRKLTKRNRNLLATVKALIAILKEDPYNLTKAHPITKLIDVKPGEGQFRIRSGDYRMRYDIFRNEVVLYSFTDRKDTY